MNRRAFEAALVRAHHDARRDEAYALVMLDMDHFKRLNDNLGHAAGDAALRLMVRRPCRPACARWTAWAAWAAKSCRAAAARQPGRRRPVADRMRTLLAERAFDWKGQAWPLSASFGIAAVEPGDANAEAVLARAGCEALPGQGPGPQYRAVRLTKIRAHACRPQPRHRSQPPAGPAGRRARPVRSRSTSACSDGIPCGVLLQPESCPLRNGRHRCWTQKRRFQGGGRRTRRLAAAAPPAS